MRCWVTGVTLAVTVATVTVSAHEAVRAPETQGSAKQTVRVRSSPPAVIPVDRRIVVHVEPHPDNRILRVAIDAGGYYRTTVIQLDGARAARSHDVTWHAVPPGPYILTATVHGSQGVRGRHVERGGGVDVAGHASAEWHADVSDAGRPHERAD